MKRTTASTGVPPNSITPGATELTVIFFGAHAFASARVRWITPAFEAQ